MGHSKISFKLTRCVGESKMGLKCAYIIFQWSLNHLWPRIGLNKENLTFSNFIICKDQSYLFKDGANPGFHEAVAGVFALASQTPDYFKQLGLISSDIDINDEETNINTLFDMALDR